MVPGGRRERRGGRARQPASRQAEQAEPRAERGEPGAPAAATPRTCEAHREAAGRAVRRPRALLADPLRPPEAADAAPAVPITLASTVNPGAAVRPRLRRAAGLERGGRQRRSGFPVLEIA